jgi:hypothetical protein
MNALSKAIQTALHPALSVFDELLGDYPEHEFQVRLWDGTTWGHTATPRFTLVLKRPEAMRRLFLSPNEFSLGEAFIAGEFDVEGDIKAAFGLGSIAISARLDSLPNKLRSQKTLIGRTICGNHWKVIMVPTARSTVRLMSAVGNCAQASVDDGSARARPWSQPLCCSLRGVGENSPVFYGSWQRFC